MRLSYKKLWKLLIDKGLNKTELAAMAGISSASMAKIGKDESVSMSTLVRICDALKCDLGDVVELEHPQKQGKNIFDDIFPEDVNEAPRINEIIPMEEKDEAVISIPAIQPKTPKHCLPQVQSDDLLPFSFSATIPAIPQKEQTATPEHPLRLATVFSGIGAIEQACLLSHIPHQIVFACDNGERYLKESFEELSQQVSGMSTKERYKFINSIYEKTGKENLVKKSYFANYQINENQWFEDIRFLDGTPFANKVDIIMGGSPCQSFSTYGHKMGLEDVRGTLFYDYARLVGEVRPKAFIFENVVGLLKHDNGKTWSVVQAVFRSLEYDIKMQVLNAADYNLPQLRKRVFVIGIRKDLNCPEFEFPAPVALTWKSTDALEKKVSDSYYLGEKGFNFVTKVERSGRRARVNQDIIGCQTANQQFNWVGDFRVEKPQPQHYSNPKIFIGEYNGQKAVARKLIPRELLRLMGFGDFKIVVEDKVMWRQTGNSVAVPVLQALLPQIISTINNQRA